MNTAPAPSPDSIADLQLQLESAKAALRSIAATKGIARGFFEPGEPVPLEMYLAGLNGAVRIAKTALAKIDPQDPKPRA